MTEQKDDPAFRYFPTNYRWSMGLLLCLSAIIVLLIAGGMGLNVLFHKDTATGPTEMSSQSRTSPAN